MNSLITNYVSNTTDDVFAVYGLPEEVIAVLFAYYSRSPNDLRTNLIQLLKDQELDIGNHVQSNLNLATEKAKAFHEKWVVGYGHGCYDDKTEVLTERGWVYWQDLKSLNESYGLIKLATLNPHSNQIEYLIPNKIFDYHYQGKMYHVSSKFVDLLVTPNHKIWSSFVKGQKSKYKKKNYVLWEAQDLYGIPYACQIGGAEWVPELELFDHVTNNTFKLLGFFIGNNYKVKLNRNSGQLNEFITKKRKYLQNICTEENYKFHYENDILSIDISAPEGKLFKNSYNETDGGFIPNGILSYANNQQLSALLEGILKSQGNNNYIVVNSIKFRDQLFELALKVGTSALAKMKDNFWRVTFNQQITKPEISKKLKQDSWVDYDGRVYCAEMSRNHVLYVRRNLKPVFCGNSVAEHAIVHLGIENASIIASKVIEDCRLASFTEKSTRYVEFNENNFVIPEDLSDSDKQIYIESNENLFTTYKKLLPLVMEEIRNLPGKNSADDKYSKARANPKALALDIIRGLLPAGTKTSLGLTINARALEGLLTKMFSSDIMEVNLLAQKMKNNALTVCPTLIKYANASQFRKDAKDLSNVWQNLARNWLDEDPDKKYVPRVRIYNATSSNLALKMILINHIYDHSSRHSYRQLRNEVDIEHQNLLDELKELIEERGKFEPVPRAFEAIDITFEMLLDYGIYRDLQRHRLLTPSVQELTCNLGYDVPEFLVGSGLEIKYKNAMDQAKEAWTILDKNNPIAARYAIPLGFKIKALWKMNFRELFHVIELRTAPAGHPGYRKLMQELYYAVVKHYPWLEGMIRVDLNDYALKKREIEYDSV